MTSIAAFRDVYDPRLDTLRRFLQALGAFQAKPDLARAARVRAAFRLYCDLSFDGAATKAELREDLEAIIGARLEKYHV